ncbi:hypothetical protein BTJ68_12537 [Hortaea werneckii EXF-2000]|uniref:Zn(2)-C6 fungal-type domain-containing protein n=2 Tax=Hortaea werneckii TaxID=91943 RepID=A0A3M7J073_HORWE|nr:hypothetical protein BTJ68_12537 [Hortaea werneckii EXF-2000]RMZ31195.1 hypothetical protein D0859_04681 [Hortaea werneckii]
MTKSTGERISKACIRCRRRKTRCILQTEGNAQAPPCASCQSGGHDCVLAGSRRGGDFLHRRAVRRAQSAWREPETSSEGSTPNAAPACPHENPSTEAVPERSSLDPAGSGEGCGCMQNPFQALQMLVRGASDVSPNSHATTSPGRNEVTSHGEPSPLNRPGHVAGPATYMPIATGFLNLRMLGHLLQHYAERYHPLMPVVPQHVLSTKNLQQTVAEECFLLTAVLTIASKDRPELGALHNQIWAYMQQLILHVAIGASSTRRVGAVEGLLILAEWAPHGDDGMPAATIVAESGEDSAWSLVGLAVRQGYLLHLEQHSFRSEAKEESKAVTDRNRLAWTYTFLLDRQISIRMGQAFWCRGIGSSARFTADDYPTLQPKHTYEDDFASVLQAQVEITSLFGQVHDILYSSKERTVNLMLKGDYTKYLDDHARALAAWKDSWKNLRVSQYLKAILDLHYEYLRLYVTAFAFQAVVCRAKQETPPNHSGRSTKSRSFFPHGIMACPDSQSIFDAIDAATGLLKLLTESMDPVNHIRYLPVRFLLYGIYAAVFLFKARSFGAVTKPRHQQSICLVQAFISRLDAAASSETHTAARYSKLLSALYFPDALRTDGVISSNTQLPERQELQESLVNQDQYPGAVDESNTPAYDEVFNSVMINSGLANSNVNDAFNIFGMDYSNFLPPTQSMDTLPPHTMELGNANGLNFHSGPSGDPFRI